VGFGRKGVFIEPLETTINVLYTDERLPLRAGFECSSHTDKSIEEVLDQKEVTKESVYYIVQPSLYYRNILGFPFHDRQKIDGVIKFEVHDYLPSPETEYITDFIPLWKEPPESSAKRYEVCAYTMERSAIEDILASFGRFRQNLKALVPFDVAAYYCATAVLDASSFIVVDIREKSSFIQYVRDNRIKNTVYIHRNSDEQFTAGLTSQLITMLKLADSPQLYVNTRSSTQAEFRDLNSKVFEQLEISTRMFPVRTFSDSVEKSARYDHSEMIALFGGLNVLNQPQHRRVNLMKEDFKPRLRGQVRLKDFVTLSILLIVLLGVSLSNLFIDMRFKKTRVRELENSVEELSSTAFGNSQISEIDAEKNLEEIGYRLDVVEESIDRRFSSVQLLKEVSMYLPEDVMIEYTDLIIERGRIRFSGKARTFADIDRMKESLSVSDYISDVKVANTGTTGSAEGFAVTFQFDIKIKEKL
jgi:Tfp pilus assembly protein PilN